MMYSTPAGFAIVVFVLFAGPSAGLAQQAPVMARVASHSSGPSLAETLTFIRQTLDQYGTMTNAGGGVVDSFKLSMATGCTITIVQDAKGPMGEGVIANTIDLSTIDPRSISASGQAPTGAFLVTLSTTNNAPAIVETSPYTSSISHVARAGLLLGAQATAAQLAKAFSRAVTLCGGKPSAF